MLHVDEAELLAKLREPGEFVYLARQVDDEVAEQVADLDIDGISFIEEPKRYYPAGDMATSLLGEVGVDGNGLSGVELRYERELEGEPGELIREVDPEGNTIPAGRQHVDPAEPGDDLVLTVDRGHAVRDRGHPRPPLARTGVEGRRRHRERPRDRRDPGAGQHGARPQDRPGGQHRQRPGGHRQLRARVGQQGDHAGRRPRGGRRHARHHDQRARHPAGRRPHLRRPHSHPTEDYTVTRILAESSNIGTIKIAQQLGTDRIDEYLRRFGFGEQTALGFPHEYTGELLPPEEWWGTSIGSIPIGQGISVTAMQMLEAYNTIANDGVYLPPSLLAATLDDDGERQPAEQAAPRRVVSPTTAEQVRACWPRSSTTAPAPRPRIEGYEVAGKTGTARKPQPGGGYEGADGRYHYVATFAGFVPADDPQLSIIVVIDEPTTAPYAGDVAAPAFAEIGRYALRHLQVPPAEAIGPATATGERVRSDPAAAPAPAAGRHHDHRAPPPRPPPPATTVPAGRHDDHRRRWGADHRRPTHHARRGRGHRPPDRRDDGAPGRPSGPTGRLTWTSASCWRPCPRRSAPAWSTTRRAPRPRTGRRRAGDRGHRRHPRHPGRGPGRAVLLRARAAQADGHDLAAAAVDAGAVALLVDHPQCRPRRGRAPGAGAGRARGDGPGGGAFWGRPSEHMYVVGVTGTNGKTTVTHLLAAVLDAPVCPCDRHRHADAAPAPPPRPPSCRPPGRGGGRGGRRRVAMEVSSHALELHRVDGTWFAVAVFTNLSQDHLDFHDTMDDYFAAKARLFEPDLRRPGRRQPRRPLGPPPARRPVGDPRRRRGRPPTPRTSELPAPTAPRSRWRGQRGRAARSPAASTWPTPWPRPTPPLALGLAPAPSPPGLARGAARSPGRFEPVDDGQPFTVLVDYAHTPDGLDQALAARPASW